MAIISNALARVKQDLGKLLPDSVILEAAKEAGHVWRKRLLDPVITVQLFVLQVLHFNTSLTHVRRLAGEQFKPSAYCQARLRLPLALMQKLLRKLCDTAGATGRYYGHKLWIADGSSASLPDTPALQKVFPQPKGQRKGCGFPLVKLLGIFDAATGLFFEMIPASLHTHEQIVEWVRPKSRPAWMSLEQFNTMPATLLVREVRYQIPRKGQRTFCVTIATTLLDPVRYPRHEIEWLYQVRWEVETHFGQLKTTMHMRVLKCKTADGVKKELLAFALAYNLVRLTMREAADRQNVDIERISFIDTLRWLTTAAPGDDLPPLVINPYRPDRHEPRVVKRRARQYDLMNKPRQELRKRLKQKDVRQKS